MSYTIPNLDLIPLTSQLAERAAQVAAANRLRGADAIYAAVASEFGTTLITWDREMLQRGPAVTRTITPGQWLEEQRVDGNQQG